MTKADLIEEVSRVVDMTRKDSEVIVEAIFEAIVRSLHTGDKIEIRGFGSYKVKKRKGRVARNPRTGEQVMVNEHWVPLFKVSKEVKSLVNENLQKGQS